MDESGCTCKVGRVAADRNLAVDGELVERWTGEDRQSTRDLAEWFNKRVLRAALTEAGVPTKDGDIRAYHRLLTDDDVTSGDRIEARRELQREGVDTDTLDEQFVSHQTVYTHLTDCLDASLSTPTNEERIDDATTTVGRLQSRTEAVTSDTIERLAEHGALDIGAAEVFVTVQVACQECNRQYAVRELLDRGGCHCQ
ncbi:hypothetical protein GRX03_09970 [Halovenus sp. WSH3]|uniref:Uncharacterized protein n=1 Tax=Halovenus carboxidivorans TaxID=2692199 RepID=A0A6B0T1S0_9EURY|nr:rod-determining factor RdfA [Halovenus carboxidivorans]MXR51925.1 hypothetical protein [Halovenus carboxidivorans]